MKKIPLEDTFADIIAKAARGLNLSPEQIAREAGISASATQTAMLGNFDEGNVRALSGVLGLHADRLVQIAQESYEPAEVPLMNGFSQFNTPFDDMTVNSYLVWDPESREAVAFDTGADASDMLEAIERHELQLKLILLTHSHGDHIFDLDRLREKTGAEAWTPENEQVEGAQVFQAGKTFTVGGLNIETRLTRGHSPGGVTYVVHGLSRTLAIVGDAIFAGSMGGGGVSYAEALKTNRQEILTLPEETVICPGHGPLTTVLEQKQHNPFFPETQNSNP